VDQGHIQLRGVAVNNLRQIDLDLPRERLIVFCGVSGSGKTSLALDTLYAEGQRRYIETVSPYTRQFLEQLDKPAAERIDGIPPAVAVTHKNPTRSNRATVATSTEINDLMGLLFARVGQIVCRGCGRTLRRETPESAADSLAELPPGRRSMLAYDSNRPTGQPADEWVRQLIEAGYVRAIVGGRTVTIEPALAAQLSRQDSITIVLDRLTSGKASPERLRESLEAAFAAGGGKTSVYVEDHASDSSTSQTLAERDSFEIDGRRWRRQQFSSVPHCDECGLACLEPQPQLFNFNRPLGACPTCHGLGSVPVAQPVPRHGNDKGTKKPNEKPNRQSAPCLACGGARLRPEALAIQVAGKSFAEVAALTVAEAHTFFGTLTFAQWQHAIARPIVGEILARLTYLMEVSVGYLALERPLRTLSAGEAQRVALTTSIGSTLVGMLYVLDEPSVGLHPRDVACLAKSIQMLQQRGNTVVVVEHDPDIIRQANLVVELGPGAGEEGGRVVFQGTPAGLMECTTSRTGDWLAGRRVLGSGRRRAINHGRLTLRGARGHNLQSVSVDFPLGVLCLVTGVSGAGKSTLVAETLYPALLRRLHQDQDPSTLPASQPHDDLLGAGQLEAVELIDQSPIGRSPRSNPATFLKAFDPIRTLFAEQPEARARGYTAGHFSFNVAGGRCEACRGDGLIRIDMQFMPDVYMRCQECHGRRYRRDVLEVKYRGRDISEVLDMTAREAFTWFRGEHAVQARLKPLLDVGLDYLRLGQPATTLSGGEAQRLKLAAHLAVKRTGRTLLLLDEPTTGLHFSDIVQLMDCFDALLDVGHSLVVVEHNLQLMMVADHLIDLGPGAGNDGGRVVAIGSPEEVAANPNSATGPILAAEFARNAERSD
jgi:excinuclease ABC subunit A